MKKAELEIENAELKAQVEALTFEVSQLQAEVLLAAKKPTAKTSVPIADRLVLLERTAPNIRMYCETHGDLRANQHGVCPKCFCHAMGKPVMAAA